MNRDQRLDDFKFKLDAVDEMFNCPVCVDRLSGNVPQCTQGHHLCERCRSRLYECPVCKRHFSGTRNYFVENMIMKFEEMKNSLQLQQSLLFAEKTLSVVGEGKFPCAGENCYKFLSYCDMVRHIKREHKEDLNDIGPIKYHEYKRTWFITHNIDTAWNEIVYIHNMGIFFVKIDINHSGNVYGHVEMANSISNAQHFNYALEIGNFEYAKLFRGQVVSTRVLHQKTMYYAYINNLLWKDDNDDDIFRCELILRYSP